MSAPGCENLGGAAANSLGSARDYGYWSVSGHYLIEVPGSFGGVAGVGEALAII